MNLINIIHAWWLIIYGILKIIVCICDLLPPIVFPFKIPFLTHDMTLAGLVLVIIFLLFSIYTFFQGLTMLYNLPYKFFTNIYTNYIVYITFSIILLVFYSLVLFTNLDISKDEKHKSSYEVIGLGGGILFLVTVLILLIINKIKHYQYNVRTILEIICICILIFILILIFVMITIKSYSTKEKLIGYHIISVMAIPLAFGG
jgi:hypothetical protein